MFFSILFGYYKVVSPDAPLVNHSMHWGFSTRIAKNFEDIFTNCPHAGGYDLIIGTSEHGAEVIHAHNRFFAIQQ